MTKGVLIFAHNNSEVDYAKIATYAAKRVRKYLNVPVTLVTDSKNWLLKSQEDATEVFDKIIDFFPETTQTKSFYDGTLSNKRLVWKNIGRSHSYQLTPYDETLVIDCDYIISSDNLSKIWGSQYDFMIYRDSFDIAQWRDKSSFTYLNQHSIPFYWATAFYFKKTPSTKAFFVLVNHIKENWSYYRNLYTIDTTVFRNDFAFSIAIHIMNDGFDGDFAKPLPGKMTYLLDRDVLLDIKESSMRFLLEKEFYPGEYTIGKSTNLDIHVMNKFSLSRFIDGDRNE